MKHIYSIVVAIIIALISHSCADEGPEPLFKLSVKLTPVSITPYTATFKVDAILPKDAYLNWCDAESVDGNHYCSGNLREESDLLIFNRLNPNTEYKIIMHIVMNNNAYGWDNDAFYFMSNIESFRTKTEGDFSDLENSKATVEIIKSYSNCAALQFTLPTNVYCTDIDKISIKYGIAPDLSGSDTRIITYQDYLDYRDSKAPYYGMISNYDTYGSFMVSLFNLESNTKYYFEIDGDFYYRGDNDESIKLDGIHSFKCEPGFITTTNDKFIPAEPLNFWTYNNYIYEYTGKTLTLGFEWDGLIFLNTNEDPIIVYYSTDSDIDINKADKTYLERDNKYKHPYAVLSNVDRYGTYYFTIQGRFLVQSGYYYYEYDGLVNIGGLNLSYY